MKDVILEIEKKNAIIAFSSADQKGKEMLKRLFPKVEFENLDIMNQIDVIKDIYRLAGKVLIQRKDEELWEFAGRQIALICEIYNGDIVLDPMNTNQYKYYPCHLIDKASSCGLSYDSYSVWNAYSTLSVRLCFADAQHAIDAGSKFLHIYATYKLGKK